MAIFLSPVPVTTSFISDIITNDNHQPHHCQCHPHPENLLLLISVSVNIDSVTRQSILGSVCMLRLVKERAERVA